MTTTTRWWWIRHAPVNSGGRIYGQGDPPADCSDPVAFPALAAALPEDAAWVASHLRRTHQTAEAILAHRGDAPDLRIEERDVPAIADDEILVRVRGSFVCGTDVRMFLNGHAKGLDAAGAERQVLGFDHTEVGALLMESWRLPPVLTESARFHHRPAQAEEYPDVCATIHLADRLAYLDKPPDDATSLLSEAPALSPYLQDSTLNLPALFEHVDDQMDLVLSILRIP